MDPEMRERPAFQVMGIQVRVNPTAADYGEIWGKRFEARKGEIAPLSTDGAHYSVYFCTGQEGLVDLLAGMAVGEVPAVPEGLVLREVPAAADAVFTCTLDAIGPTWGRIYGGWLEQSGFERDSAAPDFECFPPGFGADGDKLTIHVPVRKKP